MSVVAGEGKVTVTMTAGAGGHGHCDEHGWHLGRIRRGAGLDGFSHRVPRARRGKVFCFSTAGFTSTGSACGTSRHYLEAQTADLGRSPWCSALTHAISGALGTAIGGGYSNTEGMSTGCTSGAWKAPWESMSGGVADWYLPSSDELVALGAAGDLSRAN